MSLPDTMRRKPELWTGISVVVAVVLIIFGGVFAIGGLAASPLPQVYELIVRFVPFDLHTYGVVMVLLGFSLLHGITPRTHDGQRDVKWALVTLALISAFCTGVTVQFAASWVLTGVQTWSAIVYWLAIAACAALCLYCPPEGTRRDGRAR